MNKVTINYWDYRLFNWFMLITTFCNIITMSLLLSNPLMSSASGIVKAVLALSCLLSALIMVYFKLRTTGLLFKEKK